MCVYEAQSMNRKEICGCSFSNQSFLINLQKSCLEERGFLYCKKNNFIFRTKKSDCVFSKYFESRHMLGNLDSSSIQKKGILF